MRCNDDLAVIRTGKFLSGALFLCEFPPKSYSVGATIRSRDQVPTPVVRLPPRKGCTEACMSPARTCKNILLDNSSKRTIRRSRNALASILPVGSSTAASATTSSSSGLRASSCLAGATTRAERPLHCAPMRATTVAALMGGASQKTGAAGNIRSQQRHRQHEQAGSIIGKAEAAIGSININSRQQ